MTNEIEGETKELAAMEGCVPVIGETFEMLGTTYECTMVEWDRDDHEVRVVYSKKYGFSTDPMVESRPRSGPIPVSIYEGPMPPSGGSIPPYDKDKANPLVFIPKRPIRDNPQA